MNHTASLFSVNSFKRKWVTESHSKDLIIFFWNRPWGMENRCRPTYGDMKTFFVASIVVSWNKIKKNTYNVKIRWVGSAWISSNPGGVGSLHVNDGSSQAVDICFGIMSTTQNQLWTHIHLNKIRGPLCEGQQNKNRAAEESERFVFKSIQQTGKHMLAVRSEYFPVTKDEWTFGLTQAASK